MGALKSFVEDRLDEYNSEPGHVPMNLVLFKDALLHVTRIHRILRQPRGNVLLIGVGGSGRQSLTRLASYIAEYKIFQIEVSKHYRHSEFREDLKTLYLQTGVEKKPTVFLITDKQIVEESFLEDLNNVLSSGEITNLFAADELQQIRDDIRLEAKTAGVSESADSLYRFFIERVRSNLHIAICMSPGTSSFRSRLRMYPALVNNTTIDWFSEWPEDALAEVGEKLLGDVDLGGGDARHSITSVCVASQKLASTMFVRMRQELSRHGYVTPTNFLILVQTYTKLIANKRFEIGNAAMKLQNGLSKLDDTRQTVEKMSVELEETKVQLSKLQKQCEEFLVVIVQQRREADEQAIQVQAETEKLNREESEVKEEADKAQEELDKAMPALDAAQKALESLNKQDLAEVRVYSKPPKMVEKVMEAVMVLRKCEPSWTEAKRQLNDPNFMSYLFNYDKDNMSDSVLKKIDRYCSDPDFNPTKVGKVSIAAKSLCMWVIAIQQYGHVYRHVAPKKMALSSAQNALAKKQNALNDSRTRLQEITDKVMSLKAQYEERVNEKETLRIDAEATEQKLNRAEKLVNGLASERERWEQSIKNYQEQLGLLVGDCMVACAFLSYAGPFPSDYRRDFVHATLLHIKKLGIPVNPNFDFSSFLSEPTIVRQWNIQGLPLDSFSTENGIIVTRGSKWPLMIDPQSQANKWVKNMEKENELKIVDMKQPDFLRTLENAIQFGAPVLIENVEEEIDPSLDPVLSKSVVKSGPRMVIRLGDKEIEYNQDFRLYLTTKMGNPHYSPEICAKTTLVNFSVKLEGLEDQLLSIVVRNEKPELEQQKDTLVIKMAADQAKLKELEDTILELLNIAQGSLLDDEKLITALQSSKTTSEEIKQSLVVSRHTEQKIDKAREGYRPCAQRSSLLFFVLNDLSRIDPMYQYSLDSYVNLFAMSLEKSSKAEDLNERIRTLNDYHTYAVYANTCRGLFARHKLLFSFEMCIKILIASKKISLEEYNFFLRGGIVLDKDAQMTNPCSGWLPENAWDNVTELEKLPAFHNITASFEQLQREWHAWYHHPESENAPLPGEWENKCNELQRMIIVRCLRPDRVTETASAFIVNNMGQRFVDPPTSDLKSAFLDSSPTTPLVFVLSPGVDPSVQVLQLATSMGMLDKVRSLSLGQGQSPIAQKMLEDGIRDGTWVYLANCHLSISWMPVLERIILDLPERAPHKDFRLWLSSSPDPRFPISILQVGVKMTTEPPRGLRANMTRLYHTLDEETFEASRKPHKYKKLLYALCFFHSILLERRTFLNLGWNVPYDFTDSDFTVSEKLMRKYLDDYDNTPWEALKFLVAELNYGGRVTDSWDQKVLNVYIQGLFRDDTITTSACPLSTLATYHIPEDGPLAHYKDAIAQLPLHDKPEAFGQHPNAVITSQIEESKAMLDALLSLQPRVHTGEALSIESQVMNMAEDLLSKGPELLPYHETVQARADDPAPLTNVLFQEMERYNILITTVRNSLTNLQRALKGLVVMSADLEEVFTALSDGKVPSVWQNAYPSLKPLGPWMRDFAARVDMFSQWAEGQSPKVFWLGGFTFPSGFLTAVLQTTSRKTGVSIDSLSWEFTVLSQPEDSLPQAPKDGVYIKGLYLEGAGWDVNRGHLCEPAPNELHVGMPVIHFKPVESRKKITKNVYNCPCYVYPQRAGTMTRPAFILSIDVKSGEVDPEHWTKRGSAFLLSLAE
eukprot:GCRY01006214.1.p1 GENE.GCRY01006214.1~~GCRY01006214.1.p1  ORF type:complete len:1920 (-),score=585.98 GCRY01006214.1:315-5459(-)